MPPVLSHELMGCPAAIQSRPGFGCEPYEKPNNRADMERVFQINKPDERARRWRLLMQFDHNDDLNWRFGDCGITYFMIRNTDLAAGRFEAVVPEMQCC